MKIGTKSVLFGAHAFWFHPFFVARAWYHLYGFPFDPRLWVAFFVHDIGYLGKPNMDGPEGESHPEIGATIISWLFDRIPWWTEWQEILCGSATMQALEAKGRDVSVSWRDDQRFEIDPPSGGKASRSDGEPSS